MPAADEPPRDVYETLSLIFDFPNEEQRLWWHSTAPMFCSVLQMAGYHVHDQYRHMGIFKKHIIPFLGVYPVEDKARWLSILTRYGIPFELSLNCSDSVVRYTYEPITEATGTDKDPYNTLAILEGIQKLVQIQPGIDLAWFSHFKHELTLDRKESESLTKSGLADGQIWTQNKLALDLRGKHFSLKAYFYPELKSVATSTSTHDLIFGSVYRLSMTHAGIRPALALLDDYVTSRKLSTEAGDGARGALEARLLSCDLVQPAASRVKIYLLEKTVSLSAMEDLWTLGGRRTDPSALEGLGMVRQLWHLLDVPDVCEAYPQTYLRLGQVPDEQLPSMANYTLHHDDDMPEPQVYFNVFGMSDHKISSALASFFENHGWHDMAAKYRSFLRDSYPNHDLESLNYLHTYVSFSYRRHKPYLSVYLHTFESGRWPILPNSPTAFATHRCCELS
uniref:Tryptophan dimethylallyltransferase n=1 Tax=Claviceps paspali TaxID=40601 RepID=G8GV75_CLAPA|nr:dimethylallyl tryptophan synthase [Claviceps paspali]